MTTPDPHLSGLARGGALNLVGAAAAGLSGIALVVVVANAYPAAVAGAFFASTSVFLVLGAACELGSDAGLVRSLSRYLVQGRGADTRRVLWVALVPVVAVACVASLVLYVAAPWAGDAFGGDSPEQVAAMLRVFAFFLPVAALHNSVLAGTRGYRTMRPTVVVEKLGRLGIQVGAVTVVLAFGGGPESLALAWSVPYLLGLVVGAGWLARLGRTRNRPSGPGHEVVPPLAVRRLAAEFWRYTAPRAVARVCQMALQRTDIVLVAALSSPRDAAVYTAATRFVVLGQLGIQAVQQVMQPTVSRLLAVDEHAAAARVLRVATIWTMAITWPVFVVFAVAAPVYLAAFGTGYQAPGQPVVVILALTMLVATAAGPVDVMLLMAGRSGLSLMNNVAALVVNVALNIVLIPWLGVSGAALAWAAAIVTRNVLAWMEVRSLLQMTAVSAGAAWIAGGSVACFAVLPLTTVLLVGPRPLPVLASLVPCVAAYVGFGWVERKRLELFELTALFRRRAGAAGSVAAG